MEVIAFLGIYCTGKSITSRLKSNEFPRRIQIKLSISKYIPDIIYFLPNSVDPHAKCWLIGAGDNMSARAKAVLLKLSRYLSR